MNEPNEQLTPRRNWVANVRFRTLNGIRRWVSNSDRRRRRRRRAERRLSPTSLSVSLLAFTSLDFMTLSHPARTLPPRRPLRSCPRCVRDSAAYTRVSLCVSITSPIDVHPSFVFPSTLYPFLPPVSSFLVILSDLLFPFFWFILVGYIFFFVSSMYGYLSFFFFFRLVVSVRSISAMVVQQSLRECRHWRNMKGPGSRIWLIFGRIKGWAGRRCFRA